MSQGTARGGRISGSLISLIVGFLLFVFFIGRAIAYNPGLSVGVWVINLAPAGVLGSILLGYMLLSQAGGRVDLGSPERLSAAQVLVLGSVSFLVGVALFVLLLSAAVLTWVLVGLLAAVLFGLGLWWLATGSRLRGLQAFLLSLPFVHFLEYELRVTSVFQPTSVLLWVFVGVLVLRMSVGEAQMVRSRLGKYVV